MNKEKLIIVSNEKASKNQDGNYFSINADLQVLPDGLFKFYDTLCIYRESKNDGNHKIINSKVLIASNLFTFIKNLIATFKFKNCRYLIVTITPYSFVAFIFLFLFRKKIFIYLMSSGHDEWRYILGSWSVWIYELMYRITTKSSKVIVCHKRLYDEKKSFLVNPSRLSENWFTNHTVPLLDKARFLYVGRFNPEKGIKNFIDLFKELKIDCELSIAGEKKNIINQKNINQLGYVEEEKTLIKIYDEHNIMILPSFTEAHPYVIDESLARVRPVIIFTDISYVKGDRKGVYVINRDTKSLEEITKFILNNYSKIQEDIKKNLLPSKNSMIDQFRKIISLN